MSDADLGDIDLTRELESGSSGVLRLVAPIAAKRIKELAAKLEETAAKYEELKEAYEIAVARLDGCHEHVQKIDEQSQVVAGVLGDAVVAELRRLIEDMQGDNPVTAEEVEERRRILEEIRRE